MIECSEEIGLMMARLRSAMADAGLAGGEVEALLGLPPGEWLLFATGRPGRFLSVAQERRGRLATELVERLARQMQGCDDIRDWLTGRSETLEGLSPLEWAAADAARLHAMVVCLRAVER